MLSFSQPWGWRTYQKKGGGPKPNFGMGVLCVSSPFFSSPPHAPWRPLTQVSPLKPPFLVLLARKIPRKYWEPADLSQTQFDKITTRETIYKYIQKFAIKVHRGRGQNFPIFISCRYLVELGPRQLGLPAAENTEKRQKCPFWVFWGHFGR